MHLRCSGVSVYFEAGPGRVRALENVSFDTGRGEFLSIVGPSGCGKTTLLRTLAGIVQPQQGSVEWIEERRDGSPGVLMVFQEHSLFPWMSVLENAAFGLEMQRVPREERESRARPLLQRFGFAGRERAYPHQLSVGMKQRVAVIRAFLSNPAVLLMDEPFAALDCQTRLTLQQELLDLWEEEAHRTVVYVTHDVEEAILLSDRVLVLSSQPGRIIAEFPVPFERPREASLTLTEELLALKRRIARALGMQVDSVHAVSA
jgi:NitT/TauT family transport system ATP-binding protein